MTHRWTIRSGAVMLMMLTASTSAGAMSADGLTALEMTRSLQRVQDRIVEGDAAAIEMQAELMRFSYDTLNQRSVQLGTLSDQEFHAVLLFVLMSGKPSLIALGVRDPELTDDRRALAIAIASYRGMGQPSLLNGVDTRGLPRLLAAMIHLVRGPSHDNERAKLRDLSEARFLAPGTMIEEAALRLLAKAHGEAGRTRDFLAVANRYLRQFPASPFSTEMERLLVAHAGQASTPALLDQLASTLTVLEPNRQSSLRDTLVRQAAIDNHQAIVTSLGQSQNMTQPVASAAETGAETDADQRLYSAMSQLGSTDIGTVNDVLNSVDADELSARNRALLEATQRVVSDVLNGASAPPSQVPVTEEAPAAIPAQGAGASMAGGDNPQDIEGFISGIEDTMRGIDQFLEEIE